MGSISGFTWESCWSIYSWVTPGIGVLLCCWISSPMLCVLRMCSAMARSLLGSGWSAMMKIRSNRERSVGGILIWSAMSPYMSNLPYFGFAAPRRAQRDLSVAVMPAFATLIDCCSIASCRALRSSFCILSISSTAATPISASTSAPASSVQRPSPNSSLTAVAVSPADVEDCPLV